ncbi:MAG: hypothetical protein ACTIBZ_09060, partial [Corynebacterium variabile]
MALTNARIALLAAQRARAWNKDRKSRNESARHEELAVLRRQVTSPEEREKFLADAPGHTRAVVREILSEEDAAATDAKIEADAKVAKLTAKAEKARNKAEKIASKAEKKTHKAEKAQAKAEKKEKKVAKKSAKIAVNSALSAKAGEAREAGKEEAEKLTRSAKKARV